MLRVVSQPFCEVVLLDRWDAEPSRYFTAYRAGGASRWILGHPVVDEYATTSSPIFLTSRRLLGKIYNAGISLGHRRDHEMGLDLGWPPLCVGVDRPAPELPEDWEARLLGAIMDPEDASASRTPGQLTRSRRNGHEVEIFRLAEATVTAVSLPLLPKQLARVCEATSAPVSVAVSLGNRIERSQDGQPLAIGAVSEAVLDDILATVQGLR